MRKPVRIQLSRQKGFNLQAHSRARNGLPAVNVARPSKWGNPHKVGVSLERNGDGTYRRMTAADAVVRYRDETLPYWTSPQRGGNVLDLKELRGKNLACFCKPLDFCHADVLLKLANAP